MPIYLDNAATANPKAPGVAEAMARSLTDCNANPGHGGHRLAVRATVAVYEARAALAALLGVADPARLIFTSGATAALNQAIWASLPGSGQVLCSVWEHNAVLRPLAAWRRRTGGSVVALPPGDGRPLTVEAVEQAITPDTKLIVLTAASNVTGAFNPVAEVGEVARRHGIRLLVDGSQVAGHLPSQLDAAPVDLWVAAGHKGLLGPQGIGLLYVRPGIELEPLIRGGTGFHSEQEDHPEELPEHLEAGTLNTPGILGLGAAADFLLGRGLAHLRTQEEERTAALLDGLARLPGGVETFTARTPRHGVGVVSLRLPNWSPADAAAVLDREFDIATRAGLHCAPLAHRALGTTPEGTLRLSVGPFTSKDDIAATVDALDRMVRRAAAGRRTHA